jgi:LysM repeat protein
MSRRSLLGFVLLNVLVTFVTVFGIIGLWSRLAPQPTRPPSLSMPPIIVTATPDPKGTQIVYVVVTATPQQNSVGAPLSTTSSDDMTATTAGAGAVPTLDPSLLPPGPASTPIPGSEGGAVGTTPASIALNTTDSPAANATDTNGCPTYTIQKGDTAGNVAATHGVSLADLMEANDLTEADLTKLQIGQVLTIPTDGCGLATEEPSPTPTRFVVPTLPPTVTIMPTASASRVEIVQVISAGDITAEAVEIRNASGGVIQMQGWKLTDSKDRIFTFPEFRIMPGGRVTVFTRDGTNTPIVLYWGQPRAVWGDPNQEMLILDSEGTVQVRRTVSGAPLATGNVDNVDQSSGSNGFTPTETKVP